MVDYNIINLFTNKIILSVFFAYLVSAIGKCITSAKKGKGIDFSSFYRSGGMPSMHTAMGTALWVSIFFTEGYAPITIATFVMLLYVIHESLIAKREIGRHSVFLSTLRKGYKGRKFNIGIGHKGLEVAVGLIIGIAVPIVIWMVAG